MKIWKYLQATSTFSSFQFLRRSFALFNRRHFLLLVLLQIMFKFYCLLSRLTDCQLSQCRCFIVSLPASFYFRFLLAHMIVKNSVQWILSHDFFLNVVSFVSTWIRVLIWFLNQFFRSFYLPKRNWCSIRLVSIESQVAQVLYTPTYAIALSS